MAAVFVDASVIVAILNEEAGYEELEKRFNEPESSFYISPIVRFEAVAAIARIAMEKQGKKIKPADAILKARELVQDFINAIGAKEATIDKQVGFHALDAWQKYGKGAGHKANLNFGDCFSYAMASVYRAKLFYKGDDFAKTDLA